MIDQAFSIEEFLLADIRVGTVLSAAPLPGARKPAITLEIDFGDRLGRRRSSAQLWRHYTPELLVGTQVMAVVNLAPRRIAGFESQVLVLGVINSEDPSEVVLVRPDRPVPPGWRLG